jgi:hypothetical protein
LTNFSLNRPKRADGVEHGWPGYLFGGRIRTSTLVLALAFLAVWWAYDNHRDSMKSTPIQVPATQVVPPGYVPDPNYTWVPRSQVQQPPTTVTPTTTPTPTPTTTTAPPLLPTLPPIVLPPPFGPPVTTTASPPPGPAPAPPNPLP